MVLEYVLTALPILFFSGVALVNRHYEPSSFFSKEYTTILKGLCALIVVYVHFFGEHTNIVQDVIGSFAYVAVTIFFLISAYGTMLNTEKKSDYLKHFWRNRLASLMVPAFVINVFCFVTSIVFDNRAGYALLWKINGYVWVMLQFYLLFYIVQLLKNKFFKDNSRLEDVILISAISISGFFLYFYSYEEISSKSGWCFERMGLVWGILLYRNFNRLKVFLNNRSIFKLFILLVLSLFTGIAYLKFKMLFFFGEFLLKIILGVILILLLFYVTYDSKFDNRINHWLGGISYEVFLLHGSVMIYLDKSLQNVDSGVFVLSTFFVVLFLGWLVHLVANKFVLLLRK